MQSIPSTLLDKIKQAMQTIGNNADPKMDIIAQKASRYISQGTFLRPKTIRTGTWLGAIDVCIRRETQNEEPTEIIMAYIENGYAKVATLPYVNMPDQEFQYQYTIGPASDVSCDFDGRWYRITDRTGMYFDTDTRWSLITFGEPYIAIVNNGKLTVQQGQSAPLTLVDSGVKKCVMIRGWKSITEVLTDQGLICAYGKTDGNVYYRNYCEQTNGSFIWELEKQITGFTSPIDDLGIFRTNDYRVGFLGESAGSISWVITQRSWSGMAIDPEYMAVSISAIAVTMIAIKLSTYNLISETLVPSVSKTEVYLCPYDLDPTVQKCELVDNHTIKVTYKYPVNLSGLEKQYFTINNSHITNYPTNVAIGAKPNEILLTNPVDVNPKVETYVSLNAGSNGKLQVTDVCIRDLGTFTNYTIAALPPITLWTQETLQPSVSSTTVKLTPINYVYNTAQPETLTPSISNVTVILTKVGTSPL